MKLTDDTLAVIFAEVNQKYFDNKLTIDRIEWVPVKTLYLMFHCRYRLWAVCDPDRKIIYLNENIKKIIDRMPKFVFVYLIFHECIHLIHLDHDKSFECLENKFRQRKKADKWLSKNDTRLITG